MRGPVWGSCLQALHCHAACFVRFYGSSLLRYVLMPDRHQPHHLLQQGAMVSMYSFSDLSDPPHLCPRVKCSPSSFPHPSPNPSPSPSLSPFTYGLRCDAPPLAVLHWARDGGGCRRHPVGAGRWVVCRAREQDAWPGQLRARCGLGGGGQGVSRQPR